MVKGKGQLEWKERKKRRGVLVTCFQYVVTETLHEGVVLIGFESRAVLRDYFIKALDAAVAHSLHQQMR